jgi:hypothetical protein
MKEHRLELADIFRAHQEDFLTRWNPRHRKLRISEVAPPRRGHPAMPADAVENLLSLQKIGWLHVAYRLRGVYIDHLSSC